MDLENTNYDFFINNDYKKCEFCGKKLIPKGLDYLYTNITPESIKYERCNCKLSQEYWKNKDAEQYKIDKRNYYKNIINKIYKDNYLNRKLSNYSFENFIVNKNNKKEVEILKDYLKKCLENTQEKGMIITGNFGTGKTHLASAIANKMIKNGQVVLMGRLSFLLDMIKETYYDKEKSHKELIELYSNIEMLIIDDLGTETISNWALEKLYSIVQNRNENKLPIIITTKFNKNNLLERLKECKDKSLAEAIISKLYLMCYGVNLKK